MNNFNHLATFLLTVSFTIFGGRSQALSPVQDKSIPQPKMIMFAFGDKNFLSYDLNKGIYKIKSGSKVIMEGLVAEVKIGEQHLSSTDYTERTYQRKAIHTNFGKGIRHVFTLSGNNLPEMQQIFYTYPQRNYILAEIIVTGSNMKSNYMSPLKGNAINFAGNLCTLFIPFDNDTFISYRSAPLSTGDKQTSAEVGVIYDNNSRKGLIIGSVEHQVWKTGVECSNNGQAHRIIAWGGYTDLSVTRDSIPHGSVEGNELKSPLLFIGFYNDWRHGMNDFAAANRLQEPPYVFNWTKPTPVGWNSWGVIQNHLTYEKAIKVVDFFADSLSGFRTGNTAYIDLDAFWDFLVKGGANGDYTVLNKFVQHCLDKGLQPGVYFAPFADFGYKGGGDRKVEGSDYYYRDMWTKIGGGYHDIDGGRSLDPTHPGTLKRISYTLKKLKDCGFTMIKVDFLGHAAVESPLFYDPSTKTGMQAFRKGMEYLDDQLAGQMLIYAAISPNLATARYVHTRRIACDAFSTIDHTKYTLNSLTFGWWQTWLYNFVDADHVVFADQPEGANRARMLSSVITGTFITGDDFSVHGSWSKHAKLWFQNPELLKVVSSGKSFEPVDGFSEGQASNMFVRKTGSDFYLAVFNYDKTEHTFPVNLTRLGLEAGKKYTAINIIDGSQPVFNEQTELKIAGADAAIFKITNSK